MLECAPDLLNNPLHMNTPPPLARHRARGFTLIELMIAVAVVGILLAVALPSFLDSIRKGRRSEAISALSALQLAQERWRSNNTTYAASLAAPPTGLGINSTSPGGYYTLQVVTNSNTATGYDATADGSGSGQSNDGQCAKLSVRVDRGSITYGSCLSCTTFTYNPTDRCWSR